MANAPNGQRHVRDRGVLMLPPTHATLLTQFMGKPQSAHFVASSLFVTFPAFCRRDPFSIGRLARLSSCLDGRSVIKRHWMAVRTGHGILMVKAVIYWQIRGRECWGAEYPHLTLKTSYTGYMDTGLHGYGDTGIHGYQGYRDTGIHGYRVTGYGIRGQIRECECWDAEITHLNHQGFVVVVRFSSDAQWN